MKKSITVIGLASGRIVKVIPVSIDLEGQSSLLEFLTKEKITIASSCGGEGTCKKCYVNEGQLSCQITVGNFLEKDDCREVRVSYL